MKDIYIKYNKWFLAGVFCVLYFATAGIAFAACPANPDTATNNGTFTSQVIDLGGSAPLSSVNYTATTPESTCVAVKVRSGDTASPDGTWSAWSGLLSNGASLSAFSGQYVQYMGVLGSDNINNAPSLDSVTITPITYPSLGVIGGSVAGDIGLRIDSGENVKAKPTSLSWEGTTDSAGQKLLFKIRSGDTQEELDANQCFGPTTLDSGCSNWSTVGKFYSQINGQTNSATSIPISFPLKRYIEVLVRLESGGLDTPTLISVNLNYDVLSPPNVNDLRQTEAINGYPMNAGTYIGEGWIPVISVDNVACVNSSACYAEFEVKGEKEQFDGTGTIDGNTLGAGVTSTSSTQVVGELSGGYIWRARINYGALGYSEWITFDNGGTAFTMAPFMVPNADDLYQIDDNYGEPMPTGVEIEPYWTPAVSVQNITCIDADCYAEFEVKEVGQAFDGQNLFPGYVFAPGTTEAESYQVIQSYLGLSYEQDYKWRARVNYGYNRVSGWVDYADGQMAFGYKHITGPNSSNLRQFPDNNSGEDIAPGANFGPDEIWNLGLEVNNIICPEGLSCFGEFEVVTLAAPFDQQNTIGSSYLQEGETLSRTTMEPMQAGDYKWRARVVDEYGRVSPWAEYNNGELAFVVLPLPTPAIGDLRQIDNNSQNAIDPGSEIELTVEPALYLDNITCPMYISGCLVEFNIVAMGEEFTQSGFYEGSWINSGEAGSSTANIAPMSGDGFKWRARVTDNYGRVSPWVEYNGGQMAFKYKAIPALTQDDISVYDDNTGEPMPIGVGMGPDQYAGIAVKNATCASTAVCYAEVEVKQVGDAFDGNGLYRNDIIDGEYSVSFDAQLGEKYKFRARIVDEYDRASAWTEYNNGDTAFFYDITPPSGKLLIENGRKYSNSTRVHLSFEAQDDYKIEWARFSNNADSWGDWAPYDQTIGEGYMWDLESGNGEKKVYAQMKDYAGNISGATWDTKADFENNASTTGTPTAQDGNIDTDNNLRLKSRIIGGEIVQIAANGSTTVGLKSDGTVVAVGDNWAGQTDVSSWSGITQVAVGYNHTVGLKSDGTVVAVGYNGYGQTDVSSWSGITQIAAGEVHTLGLKADGTVVGVGENSVGQTDVYPWTGITQIAAGAYHSMGVKANGTVVAVGENSVGQTDVSSWSGITQVAAGGYYSVGLKNNGTVVAVGEDYLGSTNVSSWSGITQVTAGYNTTVGLKGDGTTVATGDNYYGQTDVASWSGITQIAAGFYYTVGLKADGNIVGVGDNSSSQLDATNWSPFTEYATEGVISGLLFDLGNGSKVRWGDMYKLIYVRDIEDIKNASVVLSVRSSDDGVNWGEWVECTDNQTGAIPIDESRILEIKVRLATSNYLITPIVYGINLTAPMIANIIVDDTVNIIDFDPNAKYPAENWDVKENINGALFKINTSKSSVVYVDYGAADTTEEASGAPSYKTEHQVTVKSLKSKTGYRYKIRAVEEGTGRVTMLPVQVTGSPESYFTFTTTGNDVGFDGLPSASNLSQVEITASSAKITWKTKVPTSSWVDYGLTSEYGSTAGDDALTTSHVVELKNLTAGLTYYYQVRGLDSGENEFVSPGFSFKAIMKPEISNVKADNVTPFSADISWTTNVRTESDVAFGDTTNYSNREKDSNVGMSHRVNLKDLADGVTYNYQIEARDEYGNATKSMNYTFATPIDTQGPKISDVRLDVVPMESDDQFSQVILSWKTDKPSTAKVEYGEGIVGGNYENSTIEDSSLNLNHTAIIKNLNPAASYHFRIIARDKRSNTTKSTDYNVVTPAKNKTIWQLILTAIEETFSWVSDMPKFWINVGKKVR